METGDANLKMEKHSQPRNGVGLVLSFSPYFGVFGASLPMYAVYTLAGISMEVDEENPAWSLGIRKRWSSSGLVSFYFDEDSRKCTN